MGRRSRKRSRPAGGAGEAGPLPERREDRNAAMKRGYARGEARNEEIRAGLEPLAPGERPTVVTVAAIVALVLAVANTAAIVLGENVGGSEGRISAIAFTIILLVCAYGMWRAKYWAVLGFQALLAIQVLLASLALLTASDLRVALVLVAVAGLGALLFWKLVRALARLQMPEHRARPPVV